MFLSHKSSNYWAVVVVKWSACSPSTPTIQVRIPLKPTFFSVKLCLKLWFGPLFLKKRVAIIILSYKSDIIWMRIFHCRRLAIKPQSFNLRRSAISVIVLLHIFLSLSLPFPSLIHSFSGPSVVSSFSVLTTSLLLSEFGSIFDQRHGSLAPVLMIQAHGGSQEGAFTIFRHLKLFSEAAFI